MKNPQQMQWTRTVTIVQQCVRGTDRVGEDEGMWWSEMQLQFRGDKNYLISCRYFEFINKNAGQLLAGL